MVTGEHPKATLIFRKTVWKHDTLYTLLGWENVLSKGDLPPEYIDWNAPRFWAEENRIRIPDCRGGPLSKHVPQTLYQGQVFDEDGHVELVRYLRMACEWLQRVKRKVGEAEEIVLYLVPPPSVPPCDQSVAFDKGKGIKKPTLLERLLGSWWQRCR